MSQLPGECRAISTPRGEGGRGGALAGVGMAAMGSTWGQVAPRSRSSSRSGSRPRCRSRSRSRPDDLPMPQGGGGALPSHNPDRSRSRYGSGPLHTQANNKFAPLMVKAMEMTMMTAQQRRPKERRRSLELSGAAPAAIRPHAPVQRARRNAEAMARQRPLLLLPVMAPRVG